MDPAYVPLPDTDSLAAELAHKGTCQEQLFGMLYNIAAQLPAAAPLPVAIGNPSLHMSLPPRSDGDPKACHGFLNQCTIHFEVLAHQFASDRAKIAFIVSLLSGEALSWATPLWERSDPMMLNL